jgi:hypothetical protein
MTDRRSASEPRQGDSLRGRAVGRESPRTTAKVRTRSIHRSSLAAVALLLSLSYPRALEAQRGPNQVFHSTQSANLPTAETIAGGLWMFEISHRFLPSFSEGADALWGLDGPVYNRLGLAYAPTDRLIVGLLRSNLDDNLELNLKGKLFEGRSGSVAFKAALMAGAAVNFGADTLTTATVRIDNNEAQYYAQAMLNASFGDRLALGVVPTGFYNLRIEDVDPESTFVVGLHGQYYTSGALSFLAEWIMSVESVRYPHDGASFGMEIETRGHFFKILATNQVRMNPTQFLVGTPYRYGGDDWRLGFNITRLLSF